MKRKLLSILTLLYLTVSSAWAQQGYQECGDGVTWSISGSTLIISYSGPGDGAMHDFTSPYDGDNPAPWADYSGSITSVIIEDRVTSIGTYAFYGFMWLTSVTIGNYVTSIGDYAFYGCSSLTGVTIPNSVTSIGSCAFRTGTNSSFTLLSYPYIGSSAFDPNHFTTVIMYLTAHEGETGEYWTTFYNDQYNFEADANTEVFKVALNGAELTLNKVSDRIVNAWTAVVLKSTGGNPVMSLTSNSSSDEQTNSLYGVGELEKEGVTADGTHYVLNKGSNGVGFYKMKSGATLGYGKAYLTYSGSLTRGFFGFDDNNGTTGIEMPMVEGNDDADTVVYDLQGRRVQNPAKGLYIVNGKKVNIK